MTNDSFDRVFAAFIDLQESSSSALLSFSTRLRGSLIYYTEREVKCYRTD